MQPPTIMRTNFFSDLLNDKNTFTTTAKDCKSKITFLVEKSCYFQ